jgi:hypothetical protein
MPLLWLMPPDIGRLALTHIGSMYRVQTFGPCCAEYNTASAAAPGRCQHAVRGPQIRRQPTPRQHPDGILRRASLRRTRTWAYGSRAADAARLLARLSRRVVDRCDVPT